MYVHCGTVYNSKDLEPTQMPIKDRLDKENVAHIHHGILCNHKRMSSCSLQEHGLMWKASFSANRHKNRKPNITRSHS